MFRTLPLLVCALGFLRLAPAAHAQTAPSWGWIKGLPATNQLDGTVQAVDAQGNTYFTGNFDSSLTLDASTTLTSADNADGYIAKYSPSGTLLWVRQLTGENRLEGLSLDAAGNAYVSGALFTSLQLGGLSLAGNVTTVGSFVAKLDPQGQAQWLRPVGVSSTGSFTTTAPRLDAAGNLYLAGQLRGTVPFGSVTLSNNDNTATPEIDQVLVKYDAQGTVLWARQGGHITGLNDLGTPQLVVAPAGDAFLISWLQSGGTVGNFGGVSQPGGAGAGSTDILIVKYDAQGVPQWLKQGGGPGTDFPGQAIIDGAGRLALTLDFRSATTFTYEGLTLTGTGFWSAGLLLLDGGSGTPVWGQVLNSSNWARYQGVAADAAGNIYAAGNFGSDATAGSISLGTATGVAAALVSYSPQGAVRWVLRSGGTQSEEARALAMGPGGQLSMSGIYSGAAQFGTVTLPPHNPASSQVQSMFLTQFASLPTATRPAQAAAPLTLFPNPAASGSTLPLPMLPAGTRVEVRDALGRGLPRPATAGSLSLAGLAPGLYHVQATAPDGHQWLSRLVVE
jgi:hypothetical protein